MMPLLGRIATLRQTRMLRYTNFTVADEIENALSYYRSKFFLHRTCRPCTTNTCMRRRRTGQPAAPCRWSRTPL